MNVRTGCFPPIWGFQEVFGAVRATGGVYVTLPVLLEPKVGPRLRGQRVIGEFPSHQVAFIGGRGGMRSPDLQGYVGRGTGFRVRCPDTVLGLRSSDTNEGGRRTKPALRFGTPVGIP